MKFPVFFFYLQLRCHNIWFGKVKTVSALLIKLSNCTALDYVCPNCTLLLLSFTSKIYAGVQCLVQARPGCICCFLGRVLKVDQDTE